MSGKYQDVLGLITESKGWVYRSILSALDVGQRTLEIAKWFKAACVEHDDKKAQRFFAWLMRAWEDTLVLPALKDGSLRGQDPRYDSAMRQKTGSARALATIELYKSLPNSEKAWGSEFVAQDETRPVQYDAPTLLETKRAMLTEIANQWCETKDEEEADKIFNFLCSLHTLFEKERAVFEEVFRKATDRSFPVPRLTRQCLSDGATKHMGFMETGRDIVEILAVARARNSEPKVTWKELKVLSPLEGCSDAAFGLAASLTNHVARIDSNVQELLEAMSPEHTSGVPRDYPRVSGKFRVFYLDLRETVVEVEDWGRYSQEGAEIHGHEQFEKARGHVLAWQKKYPEFNVKLVVWVRHEFMSEPMFKREQRFVP